MFGKVARAPEECSGGEGGGLGCIGLLGLLLENGGGNNGVGGHVSNVIGDGCEYADCFGGGGL